MVHSKKSLGPRGPLSVLGTTLVALTIGACTAPETPEGSDASGEPARPAPGAPLPEALWTDATAELLDSTGEWTNKVELAEI